MAKDIKPSQGKEKKPSGISKYETRSYKIRRKKAARMVYTGFGFFFLFFALMLIRGILVRNKKEYDQQHSITSASSDANDSLAGAKGEGDSIPDTSQEDNQAATPAAADKVITISVVGDCTLGTDVSFDYETSVNHFYEMYGPDYFFQNVKDIFAADDLTIANMESTFTTSDDRRTDIIYCFKADPEVASILPAGNIDAVNTANNHAHDYGEQGRQDTLAALDAQGIVHFGYEETAVMDVKGVKVGMVGIYELIDHLDSADLLKTNIQKVKDEGSDIVIAIFHWGNELDTAPDSTQIELAHTAIDLGADLVCGHHAHVIQGIEIYKDCPIVYGLANFCFGGNIYPADMDTFIFQQTFTVTSEGVLHDNVTNIIPCSVSSEDSYNNYQPTPQTGEDAERILNKLEERSSNL